MNRFNMVELAVTALGGALIGAMGVALARPNKGRGQVKPDQKSQSLVFACEELAASGVDSQGLSLAVRTIVHHAGADAGILYLTDAENRDLMTAEAAYAIKGDFQFNQQIQVGHGVAGHAAQTLHETRISSAKSDMGAPGELDHRTKAAVAIPLISSLRPGGGANAEQRFLGVIQLLSFSSPSALAGQQLDPARALGAVLSLAVGYQLLEVFQQKTLVGVMEQLSAALEDRDPYSAGHSARAGALAMLIGEQLNLTKSQLEEIRLGMALHDIGKVAVPDAILHKTDKLTEEEFNMMKTHTTVGWSICRSLMLSPTVLMMIRSHHEKLDGSGYPDGLKGDELPLPVRIAGVAIAYDAMKSRRSWREALTPEETLTELTKTAGRQYDSVIVQTLRGILDQPGYLRVYPEDTHRRAA